MEGRLEPPPQPYTGRLPHVIFKSTEELDEIELWQKYLDGEVSVTDYPGKEAHNKSNLTLMTRLGILPKIYLLDPEVEFGL